MGIEVAHLCVSIAGKNILQDLTISFAEGKRTVIIGPNGVGKSTLLRTLAGIQRPAAGRVLLDGEEIRKFSRKKLARRLAILPQGMTAPPDTTVQQLVAYGRFPYRSIWGAGGCESRPRSRGLGGRGDASGWIPEAAGCDALRRRTAEGFSRHGACPAAIYPPA